MKRKYTEEQIDSWVSLYQSGLNCHSINHKLGVDFRIIWKYLKKRGVTFRDKSESYRKHKLNKLAFDQLNEKTIYWLGVLYGDGSITGNNISLCGHRDDLQHGKDFLTFLGAETYPITLRTDKKAYQLQVSNKYLANRLRELGLYENKGNTISFPSFIPTTLLPHFIRGLFDTDGCIVIKPKAHYTTKQGCFSLCLNYNFLEKCKISLNEQTQTKGGLRRCYNHITGILSIEGRDQLLRVRDWLYKDATIWLARKKAKFYTL